MLNYIKATAFLSIFLGSFWFTNWKYENTFAPLAVFAFWFILGLVAYRSFNAGRKYERDGGSDNDYDSSGNDNVRRKFWDYM